MKSPNFENTTCARVHHSERESKEERENQRRGRGEQATTKRGGHGLAGSRPAGRPAQGWGQALGVCGVDGGGVVLILVEEIGGDGGGFWGRDDDIWGVRGRRK